MIRILIVFSYPGYIAVDYPYSSKPPATIGWSETATDMGFVAPSAYTSGDIICHRGAANAKLSAPVAAGGAVTMYWNTWDPSHHGPIVDYIASCGGDCATVDKSTLEFVKIAESGLISGATVPGVWATDNMMSNNNSWTITIPPTLAPGNYVLRHELIALHSADSRGGAQNFPQCVNLQVTGSGSATPSGTRGQSLYSETDPGIFYNIYLPSSKYTIPGPTLWSGGSSGPAAINNPSPAASVVGSPAIGSAPTTLVTSVITKATGSGVPSKAHTAHHGPSRTNLWSDDGDDEETDDEVESDSDGEYSEDSEDEECDE
jgi:hypothetical protein